MKGKGPDVAFSTVLPRRKPGQETHRPVHITLEMLERYSNMSLVKASVMLGISPTAMKKACRRLGVTRWPRGGQAQESSTPAQIDGAYVRRIQRKHAASMRKQHAGAGAPAGGAAASGDALLSPAMSVSANATPASEPWTPASEALSPPLSEAFSVSGKQFQLAGHELSALQPGAQAQTGGMEDTELAGEVLGVSTDKWHAHTRVGAERGEDAADGEEEDAFFDACSFFDEESEMPL